MDEPVNLQGRTVLITGAGNGIGQALARGFASDGANVVACDVDDEGLEETVRGHNGSFEVSHCDVTSAGDVEGLVSKTLDRFGQIDVLFNNAGVAYQKPFHQADLDTWLRVVDINLTGVARLTHAVLPLMIEAGFGRIITTVSRGAEGGAPGASPYGASKAGAVALTRSLGREMKQLEVDVLVNGMVPGMTNSKIWGVDMPQMQSCEAVYPHAKFLATLPKGSPNGETFWNSRLYPMFAHFSDGIEWDPAWEEAGNVKL